MAINFEDLVAKSLSGKKGGMKEAAITRDNKLGGRSVRITSIKTFSLKEPNRNEYELVDETTGTTIPAARAELSALERGHYYVARQVGRDLWEVSTPARYADEETQEMLPGVHPIPVNEKLIKDFGAKCYKWACIDDKFRIPTPVVEMIRKAVVKIHGVFDEVSYDLEVAAKHLEVVLEQWQVAITEQQRAVAWSADMSIAPEEVKGLGEGIEGRITVMTREVDNIQRHLSTALASYGPKEDRSALEAMKSQAEQAIAACMEIQTTIETAYQERVTKVATMATKGSAPETVSDLLGELAKAMPALSHLRLEGQDILIPLDEKTDKYVRVTAEGAKIWSARKVKAKGRFGKLEM